MPVNVRYVIGLKYVNTGQIKIFLANLMVIKFLLNLYFCFILEVTNFNKLVTNDAFFIYKTLLLLLFKEQ